MVDIKRDVDKTLSDWKELDNRKPLIVKGARQVGKSYAVRKWAKKLFDVSNFLEINLEERKDLHSIFEKDLQVDRILDELEFATGLNLKKPESLLFLDEVQTCPQAIMALRYFYEKRPELYLIAAGSLIDFVLEEVGFPVGRVDTLYLYPISFFEFIEALGKKHLRDYLEQLPIDERVSDPIHSQLLMLLKQYYIVGGMPEAVSEYIKRKDLKAVSTVQRQILAAYKDDFPKYSSKADWLSLDTVFDKLPFVVGNTRVIYSKLDRELRGEKIKRAINLLGKAQLITPVVSTTSSHPPLKSGSNGKFFKVLFLDIGLLQYSLGFDWTKIDPQSDLTLICHGKFAEQFVGQELLAAGHPFSRGELYYWLRLQASAEVDYLIERDGSIHPLEVKSGKKGRLKSLAEYQKRFSSNIAFVLSQRNSESMDDTYWLPLYCAKRLL